MSTSTSPRQSRWQRLRGARIIENERRSSTVEHLSELRNRLVASIIVVVAAFIAAYALSEPIFSALDTPLHGRFKLVTLSVTEPFMTIVMVAAYAALIVATPVIVYNLYRYIAPALPTEQRRAALPYLMAVPALFAGGIAFGYAFVLGPSVRFLLGMGADKFDVQVRAQEYYSFVSMTLLGMGLIFLAPLLILGLARIGLVTSALLRKNRRFALLGSAIVAALLPTADPVSLAIEMLPLVVLFELSILLVRLQERVRKPARTE